SCIFKHRNGLNLIGRNVLQGFVALIGTNDSVNDNQWFIYPAGGNTTHKKIRISTGEFRIRFLGKETGEPPRECLAEIGNRRAFQLFPADCSHRPRYRSTAL